MTMTSYLNKAEDWIWSMHYGLVRVDLHKESKNKLSIINARYMDRAEGP